MKKMELFESNKEMKRKINAMVQNNVDKRFAEQKQKEQNK